MYVERAYAERETLSDRDLERLRAGLIDQVQRYEEAIENYPPDRMEKFGLPRLMKLKQKVADVDATIAARRHAN